MPEIINRSFTSGEIAPALRSRTDTIKYATGLAKCENFLVRPQGGVYSRPGTRFIGELDFHDRKARLIPFSFNVEQTYILVFEHNKMRIIKDGGFILSGGSIYEIVTPYSEDQLSRLQFTQDADVMTIVHPIHDPKTLSRLTETNWVLADIDFSSQVDSPVWTSSTVYNISGVTNTAPVVVTVASTTGLTGGDALTIDGIVDNAPGGDLEAYLNGNNYLIDNVTATTFELRDTDATGLTNTYVSGGTATTGNLIAYGAGAGTYDKDYTYVVTAIDADGVESLPSVPATIKTPSLSTTAAVRLEWDAVAGASYYRIYKDPSNRTDTFGWIGNSNTTTFDDFNIAPITSDSPPQDRQPFNGMDNKPSVVSYYQQRQVYANTNNEPQTVFTTQTAIYDSMRTSSPSRADDAVTFTVKAQQVNEIRHIIPLDSMILLTSGGEWKTTEGQDQVLTPSTIGVRSQSFNGTSWVRPVIINSTALYVQEKGTRVRDLGYEFSSDKYTGNDLSLMSEHLFDGHQIVEMAWAAEPYGILWCVRDDGVLLGLTYQREHQVWGWHVHTTDGDIEAITTISEDGRDAPYMIVKRSINGTTKRYVERLEVRDTSSTDNVFCVDSGLTYNGAPATIISGLGHLEGKAVSVVADGDEIVGLTVSGGSITLPYEASIVHVGLPFTPVIETLDIDVPSQQDTLKSREMSINRVIIEMEESRGGWVGPKNDDNSTGVMNEIKPRFEGDGYGPIPLKTFKFEQYIEPQWAKTGGLRIEQRSPYPVAILSIIPRLDSSG